MKTGCCGIAGVFETLKTKAMRSVSRAIVAVAAVLSADFANAAAFNMLSCCPGEDCARQARFVWHSDSNACTLWYAKASAPGSAVEAPCASVQKPVAFRSSDVSYYKYTAEISILEPGTEYIYYVKSGSSQSPVQKFKTAGTSGSYNFLWLSDVHSHPDNPGKMDTVELLRKDAEARTASSGGIDFVLFSGDAVKYGSRYDNWQQWNGSPSVTNYTFAMIPGNKEYYYTGSSTFYDYYWYLAVKNNPPNGPGTAEQEGCYWFLRDSVMFVGIDSLIHKGSRMTRYGDKTSVLRDQTNWFDRVVTSQRGNFRYLIVVQHDPWFVCSSDGFDKSRGNYDVWRHVFDKHKVDLALSGDEHNYIRSKPLRGDSANSDGTVYMVAGQIEESNYSATVSTDIDSFGNSNATKYFACMGMSNASCGAAWIEVRPTSLKVTEFWDKYQSPNYKQYDSFEITPKDRGFVYDPSGGTTGGDATPHRRYRFKVDAPRSDTFCMQLSEIQLLDASGTAIPSNSFTIAYDSTTTDSWGDTYPSNESPPNAVDGNLDTKWLDWRAGLNQSAATRSAAWIDFCFDSPTAVYGYRWYTANDASERTPVSWTFSASDDGGATWTVLDKVEGYDTTTEFKALAYSKRFADLPLPPTTAGGTYYALCVGLNEYSYVGPNLNGCVTDAKNVLSACTNAAKGVWSPANCHILTDSGATLSAVRAQFQALASQAASGDTVLYYHSSHGGVDELCTYNKDYTASDFASDLLRFRTGVRVVVLIDACHSASMFKGADGESSAQGPWNFAASVEAHMAEIKKERAAKGYKAEENSPSIGWMTACDDDELSLDWGTYYGGMFTYNFVNVWKSADTDANGDGYNDFLEIFNVAAPLATDEGRAPQKLNDDVLASVAVWRLASADEFTWKGGYDDNRISSGRNWEGGVAPAANSDATLVFPFMNNTTVLNDYTSLYVKKIVFPASNYSASFTGGPVTIAENIVNNASVTNTFETAVTFGGNIDVTGEMDFPGGVTGTVPANHKTFRGNYNLTTTGSWTPASGSCVPFGSTLSMPNGTFYCHINSLTIERNATVTAGAAKIDRTNTAYLLGENDGLFKTTGVLTSSGSVSGTKYHYLLHTGVENSSEGLLALDGIRIKGSPVVYANSYGGKYEVAIGNNGIKKDTGVAGYFLIRNDNKPEYIGSWCNGNDYKIAIVDSSGSYPTDTSEYVIYGSRTDRTYNINFDTTDCFNAGVRNTVRDMSPICGAAPANVSVGIYGSGEFRFENTAVNATGLYSGGTVVSNSATVAILAGSCPGRGDLSLRDTATLSLPGAASGTANVFGTLSLAFGTTVSFGRLDSETTALSVGGLTVGAGSQKPVISVNVSELAAGTYTLIASSSATSATTESFTLSTSGTSDKTISLVKSGDSICLEVAGGIHGKWIGGNGDDRFSVAANWDDGKVPSAGDALDFSSVASATTIVADVNATFGAITMGSGVVTFTGSLTAGSYSNLSKVAVGANATVTLVGDLVFANKTDKANDYIAYAIAAGGAFVVTGDIVSSQAGKGYLVPTVNGGDGMIVAKGLVQNSSCSDNPSFRLVRDAAGTVRWVIGADGISGTKNYWLLNNGGKPTAIIKPDNSDFAISAKIGNRQVATLRFDTTGRDGTGHTITITGSIYREGNVNVEGAGTVVCSYVQSDSSNPFIVSDTATLALNAGSNIGTGGVTVNSGAALALSGAGTARTGGAIALKSGSRLVFGPAGAQGYSSLSAKSMSIDGNAVFEIPSQTLGEFTVLTLTDGSLDASAVSKLALSVASPDPALVSTLVVADGGKSVKVSTVHAWPEDWNGGRAANAAMQTEFAKWIAVPGNDPSSARAEAAFLLGLDLADYKEDLKVVSVAMQDGRFAIDVNVDLAKVRGRLYVLVADSPVDMEKSGNKITVSAEDISEVAGIDASGSAKFFKVGVDYGAATP